MPAKSQTKRTLDPTGDPLPTINHNELKRHALKVLNVSRPVIQVTRSAKKARVTESSKENCDMDVSDKTALLGVPITRNLRRQRPRSTGATSEPEHSADMLQLSDLDLECSASSAFESDVENISSSSSKSYLKMHVPSRGNERHRGRSVGSFFVALSKPLSCSSKQMNMQSIGRALRTAVEEPLPPGVRDVDLERPADNDLINCGDLAPDIVGYMRSFERRIFDCFCITEGKSGHIKPHVRAILMDWLTQVQHHLKLNQNTFYLAVDMVDRCVHATCVPLERYQLLGVTAIFVASKLEERYPVEIEQLVYLTDHTYAYDDLIDMERFLLQALKFSLISADADFFLRRFAYCAAVMHKKEVLFLSQYLMDLLIPHSIWREVLPSKLAAAALCLAGEATQEVKWDQTMEYYSTYSYQHLRTTMAFMAHLLMNSGKGRLVGAYQKYQSVSTYGSVANNSVLTLENARIREHAAANVRPVTVIQ